MKKIILIITALLFAGSVYAQTGEGKGFQWSVMYRFDWYNWSDTHNAADLSVGYRFSRANYLGFQTGYILSSAFHNAPFIKEGDVRPRGAGVPLLLDYTHYYPLGTGGRHSVYVGTDIGYLVRFENTNTMFLSGKLGFDFEFGNMLPHLMVGLQANFWGLGATVGFTF
ncbi:MAG: hypothetical protein IKH93_03135 [Bacteroidales bacterium]|nr:hypothetical protein [Bacteroidales bacterium]MBR3030129.1 hypothetical protein [Bacteroidales bacterium]